MNKEDSVTPCWECGETPAHYESYYGIVYCENCLEKRMENERNTND